MTPESQPRIHGRSAGRLAAPALAAAILLAASLAFAACGPTTPSPTPTPSPTSTASPTASTSPTPSPSRSTGPSPSATTSPADTAVYASIERDVQQLRGLTAARPVVPRLIDEAGLKAYIDSSLADVPTAQIASSGALLKALGLLPPDVDLSDEFKKLFTTQVAGFYEPETKQLYVVSKQGGLGAVEKVTFAHEFTHALQDQNHPDFGGTEFQGAASGIIRTANGNSDRSLGELGLVEGDPTLVMTLWASDHLSPSDLLELLAAANDPATAQILAEMPPILRETLMFPYTTGLQLVLDRQLSGGWPAVDRLYANPPASTEQLLHPDKYPGDRPVTVELPADLAARMGAGWSAAVEDTLGELQLRVWLESGADPAAKADADAAAAGWGGDRIELLQGPNGAWALILQTAWDTVRDAAEFTTAAKATIGALGLEGDVLPGMGGKNASVVLASGPSALGRLANVLGLAG